MNTYFAADGSYGDADHLVTIDTSEWTGADWNEIDGAPDDRRRTTALAIARRHSGEQS
jgi:hypothetical protein